MSLPVILLAVADRNLQEAFGDLEGRLSGSGTEFFIAVDRCLSRISVFPEIAPRYSRQVRRQVVVRYGYGIFYTVEPSRIVVVNILNLRQDEREIRRQLSS